MLNKLTRKDIEIMAPVGSYESLMAAIKAGANSIYFGVEKLNMRSGSAANFTLNDLHKIATICKDNNIKSYLTVNCILYNEDLENMHQVIDAAKEAGVTAIIASDQAAIMYASKCGVEIHISTQLNLSNIDSVEFYSHWADVVVLARELNITQVKEIYNQIIERDIRGPKGNLIEIEMFAHGALCMAVSGKCYLSLHEVNQSANRGSCRQICRRAYEVKDIDTGAMLHIENQHIMSPKDLCTIDFLDQFINAGVRVLKIEGRARGGEYVKKVCECYNEAIDSIINGTFSPEKTESWKTRLSSVFNRGFWNGYYMGQRLGEWSENYGSAATRTKVYVGKVTNYFKNLNVVEVLIEASTLSNDDEVFFSGETTGIVEQNVENIHVDMQPIPTAIQGTKCSFVTTELVRRSDKLYKWVEISK